MNTYTEDEISIDMVHAASGDHYLTAFDALGEAMMSIDESWNITDEPVEGERTAVIATLILAPIPGCDLTTSDPLEEALLATARDEWPAEEEDIDGIGEEK